MKKYILPLLLLLVAVSFAQTSDRVILVSDTTSVDLSIAKAAGEKAGIPVLVLTDGILSDDVRSQLSGLSVRTVYLVGGPAVIKPEVETELSGKYTVVRLWGYERTGTAVAVARHFWSGGASCAVIADDTKDSNADTNLQTEASSLAASSDCPFIPVPRGTMPAEVLAVLQELNITKAKCVGADTASECRAQLSKFQPEVLENLDDVSNEISDRGGKEVKLLVIAAPNWKYVLGYGGNAGRYTIVRIVNSADAVPQLVQLVNEKNITDVRVLGQPALADEIASKLAESGINATKITGDNAEKLSRDALNETIKKWEERRREALQEETQIRTKLKAHISERLSALEDHLNDMETELSNLNLSGADQARVAAFQAKIDAAQSQVSAIQSYIDNNNFDQARIRIDKLLSELDSFRWLYRNELRLKISDELENEENSVDNTKNVDISSIENRLGVIQAKCNSSAVQQLIDKAKSLSQEVNSATSSGDYAKAGELSVELKQTVNQAKIIDNLCERGNKVGQKIESAVRKRLGNLKEGG